MTKVLLATNNQGKVERYNRLLKNAGDPTELVSLKQEGIESIDVEENETTLAANAEKKARAYFELTDLPILANDTGFWVQDEGLIIAPRRQALVGYDEASLTNDEINDLMLKFWKGMAEKNGGQVDAAGVGAFVLIDRDGVAHHAEGRREITLTNIEHGKPHPKMPIRSLYISKVTGRPGVLETEEEELAEMRPLVVAMQDILRYA